MNVQSKSRAAGHRDSPPRTPARRARPGAVPVVVDVEPLEGHLLRLTFADRVEGTVDVAAAIGAFRGVFAPLGRRAYFRRVRVDQGLGTVCWPNGADIAPETLRDALTHVTRARPGRRSSVAPAKPAPGASGSVPEICRFFGVVIQMYLSKKHPPHFHVRYSGWRASVDITTLGLVAGSLPPRVLGFVTEWAALHRRELAANWERARRGRRLRPIAPLE
jgi:hypothetical protein